MDYHGLVATNLPRPRHPASMDAQAEDRYYREHAGIPFLAVVAALATALVAVRPRLARRPGLRLPRVPS